MKSYPMTERLLKATCKLPDFIDKSQWKSLLIDYETPNVERVYTNIENGDRLSLHVIHPCEDGQAFFHPHPWPSAIHVVTGRYKMDIGYGSGLKTPPISMSVVLVYGSYYEMSDPNGWHSVQPLKEPSTSIMVNGPTWERQMPKTPERKLKTLPEERVKEILQHFRIWWFAGYRFE